MLKGTIVENSLEDKDILSKLKVTRTWRDGSWTLHAVEVDEKQIDEIAKALTEGPWYVHFWEPGQDEFIIAFKDRQFRVRKSDPTTLKNAIAYGTSMGIPEEQLDFPTD